jgi:V-type ATPase 116kDa subunit family
LPHFFSSWKELLVWWRPAQTKLEELEVELLELNTNSERLARSYSELLELQLVLEKASQFFDDAQHSATSAAFERSASAFDGAEDIGAPLLASEPAFQEPKSVRLGFVAGLIPQEKLALFERLLFRCAPRAAPPSACPPARPSVCLSDQSAVRSCRATRGNMYLKYAAIGSVADPSTGDKVEKAVFVVFFAGERARTKILKVRPPCTRALQTPAGAHTALEHCEQRGLGFRVPGGRRKSGRSARDGAASPTFMRRCIGWRDGRSLFGRGCRRQCPPSLVAVPKARTARVLFSPCCSNLSSKSILRR